MMAFISSSWLAMRLPLSCGTVRHIVLTWPEVPSVKMAGWWSGNHASTVELPIGDPALPTVIVRGTQQPAYLEMIPAGSSCLYRMVRIVCCGIRSHSV